MKKVKKPITNNSYTLGKRQKQSFHVVKTDVFGPKNRQKISLFEK